MMGAKCMPAKNDVEGSSTSIQPPEPVALVILERAITRGEYTVL